MSKFLVLECGSKSLKIHRRTSRGEFEKVNVAWTLGHEVYRQGNISAATRQLVRKVIEALQRRGFPRRGMLAIATGAVRDAPDREEFLSFLHHELKIEVRVLTGREEASLLAQGFISSGLPQPALAIDIGGGSLEMVYLGPDRTSLRDSLPLGAIRLHYLGAEAKGGFNHRVVAEFIEGNLQESSVLKIATVHGTGGPVKAISKVLGSKVVALEALRELEERVMRDGPPETLSRERKAIFLPGVMVMRRLLEHCGAATMTYERIPIGQIFLDRFLSRMHDGHDESENARHLQAIRITNLHHPRQVPGAKRAAPLGSADED